MHVYHSRYHDGIYMKLKFPVIEKNTFYLLYGKIKSTVFAFYIL